MPEASPKSALSEPRRFIAERPLHGFLRRHKVGVSISLVAAGLIASSAISIDISRRLQSSQTKRHLAQISARTAPPEAQKPPPKVAWTAADFTQVLNTVDAAPSRVAQYPIPIVVPVPEPADVPADRPEVAAPAPESVKSAVDTGSLIARAEQYLRRGQYTTARYIYEDAYTKGDILGALGMAQSYDAKYLKTIGLRLRESRTNAQRSQTWYQRAAIMDKPPTP